MGVQFMTRKYRTDYGKTLFVTEKFYLLFFLCMKRTTENTFDFSPKKCCNLEKICYNEFQMKEVPVRYLHSFCMWISCRLFFNKTRKGIKCDESRNDDDKYKLIYHIYKQLQLVVWFFILKFRVFSRWWK